MSSCGVTAVRVKTAGLPIHGTAGNAHPIAIRCSRRQLLSRTAWRAILTLQEQNVLFVGVIIVRVPAESARYAEVSS
jgi:hypothetical protein